MATDMDVIFNGSGAHYLCAGASQISVGAQNHPLWRWFCGGLVQTCSEDTLAATVTPFAPKIVLTCTEVATNIPDLVFATSDE